MDKLTLQGFLDCVKCHEMTVLMDNGVYRHIRFKAPNTINQHFDLVTWPNYLSFSGDMGSYVFSRCNDMFSFFTGNDIKSIYWAEKLEAVDRTHGYTEFSADEFRRIIMNDCESQLFGLRESNNITPEQAQDVLDELEEQISGVEFEHEAFGVAFEFDMNGVRFPDFGENAENCEVHTYRYLWACYAIQWGVGKYFSMQGTAK